MKHVLVCLVLLMMAPAVFSQRPDSTITLTREDYLLMSKHQKTTGWVFLGVGAGLVASGFIVDAAKQPSPDDPYEISATGASMIIVGMLSAMGSIPFFVNSSKNAKRAAEISLNNQNLLIPRNNAFVVMPQPTLTLKIPF